MNYTELNIVVSDALQAEILTAELADFPFESFQAENGILKAYIPQTQFSLCHAEVDALLDNAGVDKWHYVPIADQNWNATWEQGFEAVDVDGRLLIRAPFHPAAAGITEVVIMPHMSFGTGHHATTHLMASALLDLEVRDQSVLDMGSGTGVLAIVAALRGALRVDAVDIDARSEENCRSNIAANGVCSCVRSILGDIDCVSDNRYDFILANINRNTLTSHMPAYASMLRVGGRLLLSGFLSADAPLVAAAATAQGLRICATHLREEWAMIECAKE